MMQRSTDNAVLEHITFSEFEEKSRPRWNRTGSGCVRVGVDNDLEYRNTLADKLRPRSEVDNTVSLLRWRGVRERWAYMPRVPDYLREALEELEALHLEERALVEACVD